MRARIPQFLMYWVFTYPGLLIGSYFSRITGRHFNNWYLLVKLVTHALGLKFQLHLIHGGFYVCYISHLSEKGLSYKWKPIKYLCFYGNAKKSIEGKILILIGEIIHFCYKRQFNEYWEVKLEQELENDTVMVQS